jgi:hypothetical protein
VTPSLCDRESQHCKFNAYEHSPCCILSSYELMPTQVSPFKNTKHSHFKSMLPTCSAHIGVKHVIMQTHCADVSIAALYWTDSPAAGNQYQNPKLHCQCTSGATIMANAHDVMRPP